MSRLFAFILAAFLPVMSHAQALGGLARVAQGGVVTDGWLNGATLSLPLTQAVPFRAYTLEGPPRLVLDFREVDWAGFDPAMFERAQAVDVIRTGPIQAGWSRLVADLSGPFVLETADMAVASDGTAVLTVVLGKADTERFAASSGAPVDEFTAADAPLPVPEAPTDDTLIVVLDPGHGGVDPGAERDGTVEKHLMLTFARELKEALQRRGDVYAVLTRQDDSFVSLERRVSIAHQIGANVFISLHADALVEGGARGAAVHTLAREASDKATENLAERHNRADILSGKDLTGADDTLAQVLLDLARQETQPRTDALAAAMVAGLKTTDIPINSRPLRHGSFSVLKSADVPSILVEVGFLSDARDLANLLDPAWRKATAEAMADAVMLWHMEDAAKRGLVRN